MTQYNQLLRQGRYNEIWTKYCGFLDLSKEEFMDIQERLLLEQIELLGTSMMGRMLMGDILPKSIEEFREVVPLTTYDDYLGYLDQKREDVLPRKPLMWSHTSGRSGEYKFKWVPYTQKMYDRLGEVVIGSMILASCSQKGEINLSSLDTVLLATAPPPYVSGLLSYSTEDQLEIRFLPGLKEGDQMEFRERIGAGFKLAMRYGLDYFYGIASVLVGIGEQFEQGGGTTSFSLDMLHPAVMWRLIKGFMSAKLKNKNPLPKDIWNLKGIMTGGTDTSIYKDLVEHYWGRMPLEGYACTEGGTMAVQAWNYQGMSFFPETNFLEFIPHEEIQKNQADPHYQPQTVLYHELEPGIYELVFTNFHGGIFTRYRVGDLFEVISTRDEELNIDLPQVRFYARKTDTLNLAGFAVLTEKNLWQAIEAADIPYHEWVARKEVKENKSYLHIYLEMEVDNHRSPNFIKEAVRETLRSQISDYRNLEEMLNYQALKVTLLNSGAFSAYMEYQQSQGADLAHTKPPHMKPTPEQMNTLLKGHKLT